MRTPTGKTKKGKQARRNTDIRPQRAHEESFCCKESAGKSLRFLADESCDFDGCHRSPDSIPARRESGITSP